MGAGYWPLKGCCCEVVTRARMCRERVRIVRRGIAACAPIVILPLSVTKLLHIRSEPHLKWCTIYMRTTTTNTWRSLEQDIEDRRRLETLCASHSQSYLDGVS